MILENGARRYQMTDKKNIYQKLAEIQKNIQGFTKDSKGYNFTYVSGNQVLSAIREDMNKLGVMLEPHLIESTTVPGGKGFIVSSRMKMVWVNVEDPKDRAEIEWYMVGEQKDASQAFGSGLTYSERYFPLKYFHIPTDDDDPDKINNGNGKTKVIPKVNPDTELKKALMKKHNGDKEKAEAEYLQIKFEEQEKVNV
jgi:hypothetical protein